MDRAALLKLHAALGPAIALLVVQIQHFEP